jgi:hypothetical protein
MVAVAGSLAVTALMPLYYPTAACAICGQPVGTNKDDVIGFDFIEVPQADFQSFADGLAHVSCLSVWQRRDEFIAAWNRALSEYYTGKELRIDRGGRVTYTDDSTWRILHSEAVQRRNRDQWAAHQADLARRREGLEARIDAARQKAVHLGPASPADVDRVIHDLPSADFQRLLGEFQVSRAFFKKAD